MKVIQPEGFPPPRGYSNGIVAQGRLLFVAGQVGWNEHGEITTSRVADQFDQAMANVIAIVKAAGGAPQSIARLTIYVVDKEAYASSQREIGQRYRARMGRHYPAMTLVEVRALLEPGALVEIEATAVLEEQRRKEKKGEKKKT
jgi:enamine deaminase RidA (YjgF/YER057c/UK114 family)